MSSKASKMKGLLSKGFKKDKCKISIKMAVARMKLMRNKRDVQVKQVRREVAQLLQSGEDATARIRVDHVIRDEKTISAYELLEVYCELIIQRLHIIDSQKICPIDLKEAIATVVFAAPRCADVPELSDVTKHFQAKYGKEFIIAALELRPGSGVSQLVVDKLSALSANIETKVKVLKSIAEENNVKWDAKGFEEEKEVPQVARLDGSSKFLRMSEMETVQPVPVQTPPPATTYQTENYAHQKSGALQPARPNNSGHGISDPSLATPGQVFRSQSGSRNKESHYVSEEENKKTPLDLQDHDAEYTTVEEAAEAAAKSAEIASKAAKAAAAMARHGGLSREQSNASSKSYSSRDSPRKHDMEEVNSKPETFSIPSMQISSPPYARGPQVDPFKPTPYRSHVAPPSPSFSQSSSSSSGSGELFEAIPSPAAHRSPEYSKESSFSKQKKPVKEDEEYGYSGINTKYNNSNSRGSTAFQRVAIWDDNEDKEEPEVVSSNLRFDSSGVAFDDSRLETYDRPVYEEESFFRFERKDSSASEGGTAWFSSSSSQLPKSGSVGKNSSPLLFTANTTEWDPPRSPADKGSSTKFDKAPKSASGSSLFNDDSSNLLSVLSGRSPSQSYAEEDSGPKFDSGPNFDLEVLSDNENDKVNSVHVHVEEEKIVEDEYFAGSPLSPLSHAKERTENTFMSSSDESRTKRFPQSLRTRDSRTNRSETVQHEITKEPRAKAEKAPLHYTFKESSSDDDEDSGNQQFINYDKLIAGRRNRPGFTRPPYTVKPLAEEPKPLTPPAFRKPVVDLSVEEERLYTPNRLNSREPEVGRSPSRDTALGNKPSERKQASGRSTLRYTPHRRNMDKEEEEEEEEETEEEIAQPAKIKLKVPSSSRVSNYVALDDEEEAEEKVVKPAKIKVKEPSSSRVLKGYLGVSENQLDYKEPAKVNRRVSGSSSRDSLEVRKNESPTEKTKKEAPSKSSESRRPLRYVPVQQDSDEEEQVRTPPPKESTKPSLVAGSKEKVDLKENKEEKLSAQPTFPRASFPLDMDALRARVQQIQATMKNP